MLCCVVFVVVVFLLLCSVVASFLVLFITVVSVVVFCFCFRVPVFERNAPNVCFLCFLKKKHIFVDVDCCALLLPFFCRAFIFFMLVPRCVLLLCVVVVVGVIFRVFFCCDLVCVYSCCVFFGNAFALRLFSLVLFKCLFCGFRSCLCRCLFLVASFLMAFVCDGLLVVIVCRVFLFLGWWVVVRFVLVAFV